MPERDAAAQRPMQRAVDALRGARRVVILTGAGVSRDSGLPTFREAQTGLWARFRPEELATPEAFARQPDVVWGWYAWRRGLVARAEPNPGHLAVAELQRRLVEAGAACTLVTQNVDGLHARAGSTDVVELHGNIGRIVCSRCGREAKSAIDPLDPNAEPGPVPPPSCSVCRGNLRPDVVWFGEMLPAEALERASAAASSCDVFLSVGTSGLVYPAAGLAHLAAANGATVLVVNPDDDVVPGAVRLQGSASALLPAVVSAVFR